MEENRSAFTMLIGKPTGKKPLLEGLGVDGRTILTRWITVQQYEKVDWLG